MTQNTEDQLIIVSALIANSDGEVLLLKRKEDEKRAPGRLELPGGRVPFGQEPLSALAELVLQQTGLVVEVGKLVSSRSFVSERSKRHILIFYNICVPEIAEKKPVLSEKHPEYRYEKLTKVQQKDLERNLAEIASILQEQIDESSGIERINDHVTTTERLIIFSDGGSRGNPGPSATGFVIMNDEKEILEEGGEYLGITTNNQAEYNAVLSALKKALKYNPKEIDFRVDSLLVVNQLKGIYKIKNKDLWPVHEAIKNEAAHYKKITFRHVPREQNKLADAKVNEVLDARKKK